MKSLLPFLAAPLLLLFCSGFAQKPEFIVRFFVEANEQDTERFATPVTLKNPPRQAYIERVPTISERNVKAVFPFPAIDGSWGCSFKLDPSGRLALEIASTEHRGRAMVAFVGTKKGTHQVIDMQIDRRISDGIITIQHGLTTMEMDALQHSFPDLRTGKKKPAEKAPKPEKQSAS